MEALLIPYLNHPLASFACGFVDLDECRSWIHQQRKLTIRDHIFATLNANFPTALACLVESYITEHDYVFIEMMDVFTETKHEISKRGFCAATFRKVSETTKRLEKQFKAVMCAEGSLIAKDLTAMQLDATHRNAPVDSRVIIELNGIEDEEGDPQTVNFDFNCYTCNLNKPRYLWMNPLDPTVKQRLQEAWLRSFLRTQMFRRVAPRVLAKLLNKCEE